MDAPERITMLDGSTEATFPYGAGPIEYIRADIADAERDAAFALGVEAGAKLAVEKSAAIRVESDDEDLEDWAANQMRASAGTLEFFAYTLRQDAPTTPLQAALALPEVRELVEALTRISKATHVDAWSRETLSHEAAIARATLAKLEAKT